MKLIFKLSIITLFIFTFNTQFTHAQVTGEIEQVSIKTDTNNPKPDQKVGIYLESYLLDLNSASIIWFVNGKNQAQGIGIKKIEITAPKIGTKMTILAIVKTAEGREIRKTYEIKTGSVDIVWETGGAAHPFFDGKIPYVYQNKVRFIAVPHLSVDSKKELDPKTLVYSWKLDGKYVEEGQGYGKQYIEIQSGDIPKNLNVSVSVYNRSQSEGSESSITLEPGDPSLSFYEVDSLYGVMYNKAIVGDKKMKNSEIEILAIPYGFNKNSRNIFSWLINGVYQNDLQNNKSITLRTKKDIDGSSSIDLDIKNDDNILQGARSGFTVYFSKNKNTTKSDNI